VTSLNETEVTRGEFLFKPAFLRLPFAYIAVFARPSSHYCKNNSPLSAKCNDGQLEMRFDIIANVMRAGMKRVLWVENDWHGFG
jgi:hypothetical protein